MSVALEQHAGIINFAGLPVAQNQLQIGKCGFFLLSKKHERRSESLMGKLNEVILHNFYTFVKKGI
jgi:hypothetical protein